MVSRNSIYALPLDGAFSAHVNGDHDHVSGYKSKRQTGLYIYIHIIHIYIYIINASE